MFSMSKEKFIALTPESKSKKDFKEVSPSKTYGDIAKSKEHTEFLCKLHMKDRLLNYCYQDNLVDVIFSGLRRLNFSTVDTKFSDSKCKCCTNLGEYRIDRFD